MPIERDFSLQDTVEDTVKELNFNLESNDHDMDYEWLIYELAGCLYKGNWEEMRKKEMDDFWKLIIQKRNAIGAKRLNEIIRKKERIKEKLLESNKRLEEARRKVEESRDKVRQCLREMCGSKIDDETDRMINYINRQPVFDSGSLSSEPSEEVPLSSEEIKNIESSILEIDRQMLKIKWKLILDHLFEGLWRDLEIVFIQHYGKKKIFNERKKEFWQWLCEHETTPR